MEAVGVSSRPPGRCVEGGGSFWSVSARCGFGGAGKPTFSSFDLGGWPGWWPNRPAWPLQVADAGFVGGEGRAADG